MRKVERIAEPDCLHADAPAWTEEYLIARERNAAHPFGWRSNACYREIRLRLAAMTQNHCAFCDGQIGLESRKTIEHFRPKSRYPELAYAWDNLFPCCDLCQSSKREQFDAALLKPDDPDYAFANHFVVNYSTGEIEPSPHADEAARHRAAVTIRLYALNLPERTLARRREMGALLPRPRGVHRRLQLPLLPGMINRDSGAAQRAIMRVSNRSCPERDRTRLG